MERKLSGLWDSLCGSSKAISIFFGFLAFLLRFPFIFRYDNHFGGDSAIGYVMALDLLKGKNFLFFGGADYVSTFEFFLMSFAFKVFGPSIQLGGAVMLLEWSVAVGIGSYLFIEATSKSHGIFAGWVAAIGVPYTMTYTTVPADSAFILLSMLLLLETYFIVEKGNSFLKLLIFGFTMGAALFISKKCLPAMATSFLVMVCVSNPVWQFKRLLKPLVFIPFVLAALVGFSPEIWYRIQYPASQNVFGLVPWEHINDNFQDVLKCSLAYFDAQPASRMQDAFYYWLHMNDLQFDSHGFGDHYGYLIDRFVLVFVSGYFVVSLFRKNAGLALLGGIVVVNFLMMTVSNQLVLSGDDLPRRYLLPAAIPLSLWTGFLFSKCGLFFSKCFRIRLEYGRYLSLVLIGLFLGRCLYHDYTLWKAPDDLREVRWLVKDMNDYRIDRGLANFGLDYMVMGLTNERIIIAEPEKHKLGSADKQELVAKADEIAVIGGKSQPIKKQAKVEFGSNYRIYRIAGNVRRSENLWWAPYKAQAGVEDSVTHP